MSIYYKCAPDGSKLVVLYYVDDCLYWYTYEELVKWFLNKLGNIIYLNFPGYAHWFMFIMILQLRDYYISVDQDSYTIAVVEKYLHTATIKWK